VHSCGIAAEGRALCWGRNIYGQLGDGSTTDRPQPTAVAGGRTWSAIFANGGHSCALTTAGRTMCWGYNLDGQLGDGTRINRTRPAARADDGE
jgi:alpha-tubulin suppressor-like RCC1 family protein